MTDMDFISNAESPVPVCPFEEKTLATLAILNVSLLSTLFQHGPDSPVSKEPKLIL